MLCGTAAAPGFRRRTPGDVRRELKNANIAFQRDVNGTIRLLRMHGLYAEDVGNAIIVYPIAQYIHDARAIRAVESVVEAVSSGKKWLVNW